MCSRYRGERFRVRHVRQHGWVAVIVRQAHGGILHVSPIPSKGFLTQFATPRKASAKRIVLSGEQDAARTLPASARKSAPRPFLGAFIRRRSS